MTLIRTSEVFGVLSQSCNQPELVALKATISRGRDEQTDRQKDKLLVKI